MKIGARQSMRSSKTWIKPALLAMIGLAFIAIGATNGEVLTVLAKATRVCLECIGIG